MDSLTQPKRPKVILLLVGLIFLLVVGGLGGYFLIGCKGITSLLIPEPVRNFSYIVDDGQSLAHIGLCGISKRSYEGKFILEAVRAGESTIAIMYDKVADKRDVYALEGENTRALTNDGVEKYNLAISPDASRIAFSRVAVETASQRIYQELYTTGVSGGELKLIGEGRAASFIDNDNLLFISGDSYSTYNLASGESAATQDESTAEVASSPVFGEGDVFMVQHGLRKDLFLLQLVSRLPVSLTALKTWQNPHLDVTYANGSFWSLTKEMNEGEEAVFTIYQHLKEGEEQAVFTLPEGMQPSAFAH